MMSDTDPVRLALNAVCHAPIFTVPLGDHAPALILQGHVMGRLLRPVDIAATVGHLLSDASAMMTGTIIDLHPEMVRTN